MLHVLPDSEARVLLLNSISSINFSQVSYHEFKKSIDDFFIILSNLILKFTG